MVSGVYLITNKINGHMYVGGSLDIERRFYEHKLSKDINKCAVDKAIKKYGADNFTYQIITELPPDWSIIGEHEKYWIRFYNTFHDRNHYNLNEGGNTVVYGNIHPFTGKKRPEHSKRMMGKNNPFYGKHHSKENIIKQSELKKGKNNPGYRDDIPSGECLYLEKKHTNATNRGLAKKYNCAHSTIQGRIAKFLMGANIHG